MGTVPVADPAHTPPGAGSTFGTPCASPLPFLCPLMAPATQPPFQSRRGTREGQTMVTSQRDELPCRSPLPTRAVRHSGHFPRPCKNSACLYVRLFVGAVRPSQGQCKHAEWSLCDPANELLLHMLMLPSPWPHCSNEQAHVQTGAILQE